MKLRVRSTAGGAVAEVSVPAAATVRTFQLAASQALAVARIQTVVHRGNVLRRKEQQLRHAGVLDGHDLVVIVASLPSSGPSGPQAAAPTTSKYELQRRSNIRRNKEQLRALGLINSSRSDDGPIIGGLGGVKKQQARNPGRRLKRRVGRGQEVREVRRSKRVRSKGAGEDPDMRSDAMTAAASRLEAAPKQWSPPASPANEPTAQATGHKSPATAVAGSSAATPVPLRATSQQQRDFAWRVLAVIRQVPPGSVVAYGQTAALAGYPAHARQVGKLLAAGLCSGISAPWWRVINSAGRISLPPSAGGKRQRQLLQAEGVVFRDSGRVHTDTFWNPDLSKLQLFANGDTDDGTMP
jgi:methylated-DNA-protein-cysteine methyltransferase-like protein